MQIKTSKEIYEQVKSTLNDKGWVDEEIIARVAMRSFAKQFIDVAWEKAMVVEVEQDGDPISNPTDMYYIEPNRYMIVDKQSILDIKQLIK